MTKTLADVATTKEQGSNGATSRSPNVSAIPTSIMASGTVIVVRDAWALM